MKNDVAVTHKCGHSIILVTEDICILYFVLDLKREMIK